MQGSYFFGDYAQNWIKRLTFDANGNVTGVFNFEPASGTAGRADGDIVYLTEGPDGSLFYVDLGYSDTTGSFGVSKIRRIRYLQSNQAPIAVAAASPTSGSLPLVVSFSSAGSNDPEGAAHHVLVGLRRRQSALDACQSGPYVHRRRPVHGATDRVGRVELDVLDPDQHSGRWSAHRHDRRHRWTARRSAPVMSSR